MNIPTRPAARRVLRGEWVILFLTICAVFAYRLAYLRYYPVHEDEVITTEVITSLAKDATSTYQGFVYWRSLIGHLLMSLPFHWTEPTLLGVRGVAALFGALVPLPLYFLAKQCRSPPAGWLAVAFVSGSTYETLMASFARFYMPFQLLFTAAVLLTGLYFIHGRRRFGPWLFLAAFLSLGTHVLGVGLLAPLVLALLLGRRWELLRSVKLWAAFAVLGMEAASVYAWSPPHAYRTVLLYPLEPGMIGDHWSFVHQLNEFIPLFGPLFLVGAVWAFTAGNVFRIYLFVSFSALLAATSLIAPDANNRFIAYLFPLAVLLAALPVADLAGWLVRTAGRRRRIPEDGAGEERMNGAGSLPGSNTARLVSLPVVALLSALQPGLMIGDFSRCVGHRLQFENEAPAHAFLSRWKGARDPLFTVDPVINRYFLGRPPDALIRQKFDRGTGTHRPFTGEERQYSTIRVIDEPETLTGMLDGCGRGCWIYLNSKIRWALGEEMRSILYSRSKVVFQDSVSRVLYLRGQRLPGPAGKTDSMRSGTSAAQPDTVH